MAAASTTNQIGPIKLFQFIRMHYQRTGIYSPEIYENHLLNRKVQIYLLAFVQLLIAATAFLLFKARSIGDVVFSYCDCITMAWYIAVIALNAYKISNIFRLIDRYDEFIRKSE